MKPEMAALSTICAMQQARDCVRCDDACRPDKVSAVMLQLLRVGALDDAIDTE
jgi:hypothetical protein